MSTKMIMDAFVANIPNCVNREMIDQASIDFCMKLNTKNNRKKLVK
jgi:regulator of nonsense transcripts 2